MANTFKSFGVASIGNTLTDIYTAPASTTTTIIGSSVANTTSGTLVYVDVVLRKGTTNYYLIKNAPLAPGGTLINIGGDQKVVAQTGDKIQVRCDVASAVDAIISVLEIS